MWKFIFSGALLLGGLSMGSGVGAGGASAAYPNISGSQVKQDVKRGARGATEKTEEAGGTVKRGAKKGAHETAEKTEEAGSAVKRGAQKTGSKIKHVFVHE